jgi:hypothetical protein
MGTAASMSEPNGDGTGHIGMRCGSTLLLLMAAASFAASCSSAAKPSSTATSSAPGTTNTALTPAKDYQKLPRQILTTTVLDSPVCAASRAAYGIELSPVTSSTPLTSQHLPSINDAVSADLRTIGSGQLSSATTIRAYPAFVTMSYDGFNPQLGVPSIINRPMWMVEFPNVIGNFIQGRASPTTRTATGSPAAVVDIMDVQTGLVALTQLC